MGRRILKFDSGFAVHSEHDLKEHSEHDLKEHSDAQIIVSRFPFRG